MVEQRQKLTSLFGDAAPFSHYNSSKLTQLNALAHTQDISTHVASGQKKHLQLACSNQVSPLSGTPAQRLVAQSDWLRFHNIRKDSVEIGKSCQGPWSECTDTTSKGYRENAERQLGDVAPLKTLSQHGIIPKSFEQGRTPVAISHLIAASLGGQIKFQNPSANIRYHPLDLEYGDWQKMEEMITEKGKLGFVTARSTETLAQPDEMADYLAKSIRSLAGPEIVVSVKTQLKSILAAAHFVPYSVSWQYTDVEDGTSYGKTWTNTNNVLNPLHVAPEVCVTALKELGVKGLDHLQGADNSFVFSTTEEISNVLGKAVSAVKYKKSLTEVEEMLHKTPFFKFGPGQGKRPKINLSLEQLKEVFK
ncbi:hypothetical protein [Pelobacter propionicus]|nr:hypothetical protein [Pelobacter propionicus]